MNTTEQQVNVRSSAEAPSLLAVGVSRVLGLMLLLLTGAYAAVFLSRPNALFADDSYFYFQVAWNVARGAGSTFNNIMPTNGYHPLWMLICAGVFKLVPDRPRGIFAIAYVIVALSVCTMLTVRRILVETGRDMWPVSFALLVPFLFLSQLGTEGALSGCVLALTMLSAYRLVVAPDGMKAFLFSLTAALAVLSRLDNIFIVSFVWLSATIAIWNRKRWQHLATLPVYAILWGAYLASNRIYFHTWQPISGLLKSHSSRMNHRLGSNLTHTGEIAFAVIVFSTLVFLVLRREDLFFRVIALPCAAGVLCHGLYIVFKMTDETRWSWYYVSWILLASVMIGQASALLLERRRQLAAPVAALCILLLAVVWVRIDYRRILHGNDGTTPASFNEVVFKQQGIHRAFAYDQPGRLAYNSDVEIIPLDGLMADLKFQRDLASMGVDEYMRVNHVDAFIGPSVPLGPFDQNALCGKLYLESTRFHCEPSERAPGRSEISTVDIYSRVPSALAGTISLKNAPVIWRSEDYVSVWKLSP